MQPWLDHLNIRPHWMSSLIISNNHSERLMALSNPNFRVVVLDDEPYKYFELINGEYALPKGESVFSVLLPPPESTESFINGEYEKSEQIYFEYLYYNPNVNHCLNTIFTLLFQNISVLLFIPQESDRVWGSVNTFIHYIYMRYGVNISSIAQPTTCINLDTITPDMYATLIDIMYTNGTIPISEFCLQYPIDIIQVLSELAIRKICYDEQLVDLNVVDINSVVPTVINFIIGMRQNIIKNIYSPDPAGRKLNVVVDMGGNQ